MIERPTLSTANVPERAWQRSHVKAPPQDGGLASVPTLDQVLPLARDNALRLQQASLMVQGRDLSHLRDWARRDVLRAAREFMAPWGGGAGPGLDQPPELLFVSGHQPSLFHPGVWIKNFAVGRFARQASSVGLHLIVDNDTFSSCAVRVPMGSPEQPRFDSVAFDEPLAQQPWEEAHIRNRALFETAGDRMVRALEPWGFVPLARDFWPLAVQASRQTNKLGECLSWARHAWEVRWGLNNLELPLSRLCETEPFLWFASHLLAHARRFQEVHNQVLREYRQVNHLRGRTHPVADLRDTPDGWVEAPFWIWKAGETRRGRVYARQEGRETHLSDGREVFARLRLTPDSEACCAVEELQRLPERGLRFRTRALSTTLFARLCLADLFVHGLGGAKYDEMTDRIVARFFGLVPPAFLMLSGTLRLPLPAHPVEPEDASRLQQLARAIDFNSDRWWTHSPPADLAPLLAEKAELIRQAHAARTRPRERGERSTRQSVQRFKRFQEINRELAAHNAPESERVRAELAATREQLQANGVLRDREYAFCLYPAETLRAFVAQVEGAV